MFENGTENRPMSQNGKQQGHKPCVWKMETEMGQRTVPCPQISEKEKKAMKHPEYSGHRIPAYDFVRAFACVGVFLFHQDRAIAEYLPDVPIVHLPEWTGFLFVTAFFLLSGCMMQLRYGDTGGATGGQWNALQFYKKRWLGIFPAFYAVFLPLWLYAGFKRGNLFYQGTRWPILLSVFGVDGYFSASVKTYYMIGEWFLGALILLYLLYPILRRLMAGAPALLLAGGLLLFLATADLPLLAVSPLANFPSCLISFLSGMAFERYIRGKSVDTGCPEGQSRSAPEVRSQSIEEERFRTIKEGKFQSGKEDGGARGSDSAVLALILAAAGLLCICVGMQRSGMTMVSLSVTCHLGGFVVFGLLFLTGSRVHNRHNSTNPAISLISAFSGITYEFYLVHHWLIDKAMRFMSGRIRAAGMVKAAEGMASANIAVILAFIAESILVFGICVLAAVVLKKAVVFVGLRIGIASGSTGNSTGRS